jgi:ribosome-binding protein aMBF1 (putative translation factor)
MKNKSEWGNCSRCGKEITDKNFGDCIEAEEVYVCDSCAEKHISAIINNLEAFRKSKEYNSVLELRKKWKNYQR